MAAKTFDIFADRNGDFQTFRIGDYITFTLGTHGILRAKVVGFIDSSEQLIVVTAGVRDAGTRLAVEPKTVMLEVAEMELRNKMGFVTI